MLCNGCLLCNTILCSMGCVAIGRVDIHRLRDDTQLPHTTLTASVVVMQCSTVDRVAHTETGALACFFVSWTESAQTGMMGPPLSAERAAREPIWFAEADPFEP